MTAGPAVQVCGLVKEFEKGRRTIWQRLRRQPDRRTRFRAVDGIGPTVATGEVFGLLGPGNVFPLGRLAFARAERSMRVRGTLGQY